jgi:hypothetical protein
LDNAERVNPEISLLELAGDRNCIAEVLRQIFHVDLFQPRSDVAL